MVKNWLKICLLFFLLTIGYLVNWFSTQTNSQSNNTIVVKTGDYQAKPSIKVSGSIVPLYYNGEDIRQFSLSQPLPEIWFILSEDYTNNAGEKINISEETKSILYEYWLKTLKHRYITEIAETSEDTNYQQEDTILVQATIDTEKKLLNTPIKSDGISRNFSPDEAKQLITVIKDKSGEITQKIKVIKNNTLANLN